MDCVTFSKAFQDNMNALRLPAPFSLFSSLTTALGNLGAMLNAFKSVGPTATVAEMIGATILRERLDVVGAMAASYYVGAVIGSVVVASEGAKACKGRTSSARIRLVVLWLASRGVLVPMDLQIFMQHNPEAIEDNMKRRSYAMRAWQHGDRS
ncbi:hypothetical protein [Trinickia dinghuensis]|uniref:Uncharacterized protein n=1 Tax=Trinickia dinghuensis TaxID=2291023 RepID=A0A3D8JZ82_9BURK|nr:hypothetical protein [Trinickia dinghuensis]RDU97925.1 hypothetical protein DWV00_15415 [Trinickia dinghuensis]